MFVIAIIVALFVALLVAGGLALVARYGFRDLFVLAVLTAVMLYLSRWDSQFAAMFQGRPFVGFHWFLLILIMTVGMLRVLFIERPSLGVGPAAVLLAGFAVLAVISGAINRQVEGVVAAVQILVITLGPLLLGMLLVDIVPRTEGASRRLRLSFILLVGLVTPIVQITSSLMPNLFGALLGWSVMQEGGGSGFVRGWSTLGGPIATGVIMVLAYGLAMHEVIGERRKLFVVVLVLVAISVLFTLSRSVLVMLVLFHVAYFWTALRRYPVRIIGLGLAALVIMTPVLMRLSQQYSFERFLLVSDESTDIRASSATGALIASLRKPLLGHGPGLLYEEVRVEWLAEGAPANAHEQTRVIEDQISAFEPHDVYLLLASEHGWPATLLFVGALLYLWQRVRISRSVRAEPDRSLSAALSALWLASMVVLFTHSGPLLNPQSSVFFWFFAFLGLHWRATALGRFQQPLQSTFRGTVRWPARVHAAT